MSRELAAMKRLESETRIPLKQAKPLFEGSLSRRTLHNYVTRGIYLPLLADRIYLEAYRSVGNSWITSKEAVRRFLERWNGDME